MASFQRDAIHSSSSQTKQHSTNGSSMFNGSASYKASSIQNRTFIHNGSFVANGSPIVKDGLWCNHSPPVNGSKTVSPLITLAEAILDHARTLSNYYTTHDLPQPSFELSGPDDYSNDLPECISVARAELRSAVADMSDLAAGPKENIMCMAWGYHDISILHFIHHFRIAEAIPLVGDASIRDVAHVTQTSPGRLKRMLRYLMLRHIFAEPRPGYVAHTPASRQLVTSEHVRSWISVRTEETGPAAFGLVASTERWGADPQELNQTPYSHVHSDGKLSRFQSLALPMKKHRQAHFANLMKALQSTEAYDLKHTLNGYAWGKFDNDALVVDVGGSTGATAIALVTAHSSLHVVVQDLPAVVANGQASLPNSLADRIDFMEYNFLEQIQPVTNADVYCFRHIFHDWPDKYAAKALQNTARVMKPGQILIIVDVVMPEPRATVAILEQTLRRSDMEMMIQFNALEREAGDWSKLLKQADPRFKIRSMVRPAGSANTVFEIVVVEN